MEKFVGYAVAAAVALVGLAIARGMLEEFANSPTAGNFVGLKPLISAFIALSPLGGIGGLIGWVAWSSRRNA